MLEIKKISKRYITGDYKQDALKDININFNKNEFVSILGPSGSGKTTLLNIIGGLDKYDKGDLIIKNKSTKNFTDNDWDSYRNKSIGFIFQSYNLINHIDILSNVEMGLTLSGMGKKERKKRAIDSLNKVGLKKHMHKLPNQLSGGQMQRVAIARALVNDPEIILADEPTGALDSKTSKEVMDLIKKISKEKLVILVTHNREIADFYSTRIIELKDGQVLKDSKKNNKIKENKELYKISRTSMSFSTALKLSFKNIYTKKGRTILTAFASSIGIIGIALILSLSNGFDKKIDEFERDTLSTFPITISEQSMTLDKEQAKMMKSEAIQMRDGKVTNANKISVIDSYDNPLIHANTITNNYIDYIENIDPNLTNGISYTRATNLAIYSNNTKNIKKLDVKKYGFNILPKSYGDDKNYYLKNSYELLAGTYPKNQDDIIVTLDNNNRLEKNTLEMLGIKCENQDTLNYNDVIGKEFKIVLNDDLYYKQGAFYLENQDLKKLYSNKNNVTIKIVGVVRPKEGNTSAMMSTSMIESVAVTGGFLYTNELVEMIIDKNKISNVAKLQQDSSYNVLTGEKFEKGKEGKQEKENILQYLGYSYVPKLIAIYPKNFDSKDELMKYLNNYNNGKEDNVKVIATDSAKIFSTLSGNIMDAITIVLIAFSAISLIVSSIMIGIITYISVLERTKEIGILRSLGARKKDITRVFNAETFIIGLSSGVIGIFIARMLIFPINIIIEKFSKLQNVASLNPIHVLILISVSILLTLLGGYIPAKIASKKDPVEALRME